MKPQFIYRIFDCNGAEMPIHGMNRDSVLNLLKNLNRNGEYRPYKLKVEDLNLFFKSARAILKPLSDAMMRDLIMFGETGKITYSDKGLPVYTPFLESYNLKID